MNLKTIKFDTFVDWVLLFNLTESKVLNKVWFFSEKLIIKFTTEGFLYVRLHQLCPTSLKVFSPLFHCLIIPFKYSLVKKLVPFLSSLRKPTFKILISTDTQSSLSVVLSGSNCHWENYFRIPQKLWGDVDFIDYWCASFLEEQPTRFFYYNRS